MKFLFTTLPLNQQDKSLKFEYFLVIHVTLPITLLPTTL